MRRVADILAAVRTLIREHRDILYVASTLEVRASAEDAPLLLVALSLGQHKRILRCHYEALTEHPRDGLDDIADLLGTSSDGVALDVTRISNLSSNTLDQSNTLEQA
jgi:hypothetical protein